MSAPTDRGYHHLVRPWAFLFDRDSTLVHDVPYGGNPDRVRPIPGARRALAAVRAAGGRIAVVTNQHGSAPGGLRPADVVAVHARMERMLGPLPILEFCPHDDVDECTCRKPHPGLLLRAAARLGVPPSECVVIGDAAADVGAALAAGMWSILISAPLSPLSPPSSISSIGEIEEVGGAPCVAPDLVRAVRLALDGEFGEPVDRGIHGSAGE